MNFMLCPHIIISYMWLSLLCFSLLSLDEHKVLSPKLFKLNKQTIYKDVFWPKCICFFHCSVQGHETQSATSTIICKYRLSSSFLFSQQGPLLISVKIVLWGHTQLHSGPDSSELPLSVLIYWFAHVYGSVCSSCCQRY